MESSASFRIQGKEAIIIKMLIIFDSIFNDVQVREEKVGVVVTRRLQVVTLARGV